MPSIPVHTLLDVQKHNSTPLDTNIVEDVILDAPLISKMPARTIVGTTYSYLRRTSVPKNGFRPANAGVEVYKSSYEKRVGQCFIASGLIAVDKAVIAADARGPAALLAEESQGQTAATLFGMEQQLFYGKELDPDGYDGFAQCIGDYMTISADESKNVPDGEFPESGASVWAVVLKHDKMEMLYGDNKGFAYGPVQDGLINDENGKPMDCKYRTMLALPGLTVKSEFALARLRNESKDHPLTDGMLAELVDLFPSGVTPDYLVMTRATRSRLRKSRSALLSYQKKTSGQTTSAETPTEFEGIPIITSDALLDDETPENIAAARDAHLIAKKNLNLPRR